MVMPYLSGTFSIGTLEGDPETGPKQVLLSKGRPSLDDEQEKFHPNVPKGNIRWF